MNSNEKYYKIKGVSCREEPPEGALLYLESDNKVLVLNNIGLMLWKSIENEMTREEIARSFHSCFDDVDFEIVLNDVDEYINILYGKGFLQRSES